MGAGSKIEMTYDDHITACVRDYDGSLSAYAYHELVKKRGMSKIEAARVMQLGLGSVSRFARRRGHGGVTPTGRAAMMAARRRYAAETRSKILGLVADVGPREAARRLAMTPGKIAGLVHRARQAQNGSVAP